VLARVAWEMESAEFEGCIGTEQEDKRKQY
jgi:hypothetical protein